jgi:TetR/AcrR family transcriptional regulator
MAKAVKSRTDNRVPRGAGVRSGADRKRAAVTFGKTARAKTPPEKAPQRKQRTEIKRATILDAALELFARYGLHGTTVDQIAEAANVSKTNLFYYFPTKEDVYVAALQTLLTQWLNPLLCLDAAADPVQSLTGYIRQKMEFSRSSPEVSRLFCLEIVQGAPLIGRVLRTSLKKQVQKKAGVINAWIKAGKLAPIDPYHLIFSIWSITQHYADFAVQIEAITGRGLDDDSFFEATVSNIETLILGGLTSRLAQDRARS